MESFSAEGLTSEINRMQQAGQKIWDQTKEEFESVGESIADMVEDSERKNFSLIASQEDVGRMAKGAWSCFSEYTDYTFSWTSGAYDNYDQFMYSPEFSSGFIQRDMDVGLQY